MAGSCESRGDSKRCSSSSSGEGVNQRKNQQKRRGWGSMSSDTVERVIVALIAGKDMEMNKHALEWALTHVVQPGDSITLLAVVPVEKAGRRALGFPIFARDCAGGGGSSSKKNNQDGCFSSELREEVRDCCYQMMLHLNNACDIAKVNMTVKVVSAAIPGAAAAEAKKTKATWVILDKLLKKEEKHCMEELHCNLVVMKRSSPKILRLNLLGSPHINLIEVEDKTMGRSSNKEKVGDIVRGESSTPSSSPELGTSFTTTEVATSSGSSSEHGTSPFITSEPNSNLVLKPLEMNAREKRNCQVEETTDSEDEITISDSESEEAIPSTNFDSDARNRLYAKQDLVYRDLFPVEVKKSSFLGTSSSTTRIVSNPIIRSRASENSSSTCQLPSKWIGKNIAWTTSSSSETNKLNSKSETPRTLRDRFYQLDKQAVVGKNSCVGNLDRTSTVRKAMALDRNAPLGPPPLCSICQHKAPVFGKPPRWFTYAELECATDGFSKSNFLAEGGFGSVYRGILPDGQAVAVKQHKPASSQGDVEFCSEVEVLSCAQHRNVVMLIGYCIEDKRRLLVYEYICNGSLDSHLYGRDRETLEWSARQKIALGAARGLRYLHEECRVGCIVHRDMRPNNILLTHDFEPMVGDFGLARWQPDGDLGVETRVIGTFGYLAPEYAQSGQITEKADVYSFGVVLVELVTGRKAVDITRPKGQQCLTEWARPLLEEQAIHELVDPRLGNHYSEYEVYCMLHAASLCIRRDPHLRPRMSQVLRILEGDVVIDAASCAATPAYDSLSFRSRSGRISNGYLFNRLSVLSPTLLNYSDSLVTDSLKEFSGKLSLSGEEPQVQVNGTTKLSYEALKAAYWEKEKSRRISFEE